MIPTCNAHAYMKFSKKNFAPYAKNATVKNIITVNKYNVGIKSLDRVIIVSDTLKTETSPIFIYQVRVTVTVTVPFPFPAPLPVPDSIFSIRPEIGHGFFFCFSFQRLPKKEQDQYPAFMNEKMTKLGLKRNIVWLINQKQRG